MKRRKSKIERQKAARRYLTGLALLAAAVLAAVAALWYRDNRMPNFGRQYALYIWPDMPAEQVMDSIVANCEVASMGSFRRCCASENLPAKLHPGLYRIEPGLTSRYVCRMITRGWQSPSKIVLSGTLRNRGTIAKKIAAGVMLDSAAVADAMADEAFLKPYGVTPETVFSLFLPDTYQIYWTADLEQIFEKLAKARDAFWTEERENKAKAQGLTPMEATIVASIVSGETTKEEEYSRIASVYLNRLRIGMKLQADPTVAFCFDYKPTRILLTHLQYDSPYNTYMYEGLPPAPICSPSAKCIDSVLNPDGSSYLYFCASPDFNGTHRFAVSYSEHLKNAAAFHAALSSYQRSKNAGI
ncbi:MAG: endolytic transglycosylase MltG [Bacteroidales bacterium]|nr:endolytic transglycosylase MltG [Bacteroidales bacterium]